MFWQVFAIYGLYVGKYYIIFILIYDLCALVEQTNIIQTITIEILYIITNMVSVRVCV